MANVSISATLTDPNCMRQARAQALHWQAELSRMGSQGDFLVGHGADGACDTVHAAPFNGSFYIWTVPRHCNVFVSESENRIDYAGAGRDATGAYGGSGHCVCGGGH
jgi:hypothetical protein